MLQTRSTSIVLNQPLPRGGTELMVEALRRHVPAQLLERVHLSVSVATGRTRRLKPHIFWAHQSFDQPSVQNLKDPHLRATIDQFVFVSEWQKAQYVRYLGVPAEKSVIIRNAIEPIPQHPKPTRSLKLIYTSTPFRGLDVLLDAFASLKYQDVELHIFSGMQLYARPEEDARFQLLYERARQLPNAHYHGVVSNDEIRQVLQGAHIFAYPCTWEETSCLAMIEAMSAACLCVVPDLAALPETAHGFARVYPYQKDKTVHAANFALHLARAIDSFWLPATQQALATQRRYFAQNYSWQTRAAEWATLLSQYGKTI